MTRTFSASARKVAHRSIYKKTDTSVTMKEREQDLLQTIAEATGRATHPADTTDESILSLSRSKGGVAAQTRDRFVDELQVLFEAALLSCNYASALKAKELIGKERGFFRPHKEPAHLLDMEALSTSELEALVESVAASTSGKKSGPLAS